MDPEAANAIIQATAAAKKSGVAEGLTPAQAVARCSELKIRTRSPSQETAATEILLQTAGAFSPNIESTALGVCTLELKGLGLEEEPAACRWAEKIPPALAPFYLDAKIGIAPTPELALLAAQVEMGLSGGDGPSNSHLRRGVRWQAKRDTAFERQTTREIQSDGQQATASQSGVAATALQDLAVVSKVPKKRAFFLVQTADAFIAQLPLEALQPAPEIAAVLARWGIRTVGQFIALGKNEISERLGTEALGLFKRVSEDAIRPLKLVAPPEHFSEQIEFENEIETAGPLIFVLRRFVEQLALRLQARYLAVGEFHLRLGLASGAQYEHTFKIPSATGNVETLFRMLQTHLEMVRTDSPIVSLQLAAQPARPDLHQFGLFENTLRNPNQFAETLARLAALAGMENIGTPVLEATHKPDAFRMRRPDFDSVPGRDSEPKTTDGLPLRRFRPPLPAHFEFRGAYPALIRSRMFNGAVRGARGPFISSGQWWDDRRWAREEWDIETTEGSLLRIFRSSDGCFIEGVYD